MTMTKSNFFVLCGTQLFVCILSSYFFGLITNREILNGLLVSGIAFFIYTTTSGMSLFSKTKNFDIINRLLMLIILQMLFFVSVALVLILAMGDLPLALFFLGLFILLLIIQTYALVRHRH